MPDDTYEAYASEAPTGQEGTASAAAPPPGADIDLEAVCDGLISLAGIGLPPNAVEAWKQAAIPSMIGTLERWKVREGIASLGVGRLMPGAMPVKYAALIGGGIVAVGLYSQRRQWTASIKEAEGNASGRASAAERRAEEGHASVGSADSVNSYPDPGAS